MSNLEAADVIKYIQSLWKWEPNSNKLEAWINRLKSFDFEKAKDAIREVYFSQNISTKEPPPNKIISSLRMHAIIPKEEEPFVKEPGKLYGKEAMVKAFADILNGPDTKTRRWLQKYVGKVHKITPKALPESIVLKSVLSGVNVNNERNKQLNKLKGET